jgi:hypothetical protein
MNPPPAWHGDREHNQSVPEIAKETQQCHHRIIEQQRLPQVERITALAQGTP